MFDKVAKRLLQPVNTSVIGILGLFNILLGTWLVMPWDAIRKSLTTRYLPEWALGTLILGIGLFILYGSIREKFGILSFGTLMGFCFWFAVTGVSLYQDWRSPGWIFGLLIAMYCGFVNVNIKINSNLLNKIK